MRNITLLFLMTCLATFSLFESRYFSPKDYNWKSVDVVAADALNLAEIGKDEKSLLLLDEIEMKTKASAKIDNNTKRLFNLLIKDARNNYTKSNHNLYPYILKLRLLSDALYSNYDPLWLEYETNLLDSLENIITLYEAEEFNKFDSEFNNFLNQYDSIYASLLVDVDEDDLTRVDAKVNYLDFYRKNKDTNNTYESQLYSLREDLDILFENAKQDDSDSTFIWILFTTGGIIAMTLTYVGYRKYRGEKEDKYKIKQSSRQ